MWLVQNRNKIESEGGTKGWFTQNVKEKKRSCNFFQEGPESSDKFKEEQETRLFTL